MQLLYKLRAFTSMKKTVLLIDDDIEEHEIFKQALEKFNSNIDFVSALNGKHGLKFLQQILPDWIFLDVNMPGMNGIETLYAIKNTKTTEHIPVFMYSTSDGYTHGALSLSMGAKKYIRKPGDMNDLERVFREILS
jgi:CheY-like chemotaxis protein